MTTLAIRVSHLFNKPYFLHMHYFSKKKNLCSRCKFFTEVFSSSENMVCIHNSCKILAWLRKCKSVEVSNKTLTKVFYGYRIRSYVNIVKMALNILTERWSIFWILKHFLFLILQFLYIWLETSVASRSSEIYNFWNIFLWKFELYATC